MDQEKWNSIVYEIKKSRLIMLSDKQKKKFFQPMSHTNNKLYVSITYEKNDKDLGVYIWYKHYSIGMTHKEFMAISDRLKDKDKLINEMIAREV